MKLHHAASGLFHLPLGPLTGISAGALDGVQSWVDAPYHRFPLLDVNTRHVGWAVSSRKVAGRRYSAKVLEMAATWKDRDKRVTVYPAPGQKAVPVSFDRSRSTRPRSRAHRVEPGVAVGGGLGAGGTGGAQRDHGGGGEGDETGETAQCGSPWWSWWRPLPGGCGRGQWPG